MDLAAGNYRASSIAIGHDSGREYVDSGYIASTKSRSPVVHSSLQCPGPHDGATMRRVPVVRQDGVLTIVAQGIERTVEWCDRCPVDLDWDWQEAGACYNSDVDFFPEDSGRVRKELIANYCDPCPVIRECLEFGVASSGTTGIWGGITFTTRDSKQEAEAKVDAQRIRIRKRI